MSGHPATEVASYDPRSQPLLRISFAPAPGGKGKTSLAVHGPEGDIKAVRAGGSE